MLNAIVIPVRDRDAATRLYTALLGEPHTDTPYYVGFSDGGLEVGLNPGGHRQGMTGPVAYADVTDIESVRDRLVAAGATVTTPVTDVGGGTRICHLADVDGNPVGLRQQSAAG